MPSSSVVSRYYRSPSSCKLEKAPRLSCKAGSSTVALVSYCSLFASTRPGMPGATARSRPICMPGQARRPVSRSGPQRGLIRLLCFPQQFAQTIEINECKGNINFRPQCFESMGEKDGLVAQCSSTSYA
ncbi:hypothetical protein LZ31DRAFT_164215 [Colletotrichum somersetense]|nr:hypothetical protein LZ31DRAFT_164215 [Colletotrichum somersetense]